MAITGLTASSSRTAVPRMDATGASNHLNTPIGRVVGIVVLRAIKSAKAVVHIPWRA